MNMCTSINLSQGKLEYIDQGSGQPIVFIHGLLVDNQVWTPLLSTLSPDFRYIMPNWPLGAHQQPMNTYADLSVSGMVSLIGEFLEVLNLRNVILVGNDTGGALVQLVCGRFSDRVAGLVLTTCDAYEVFPPRDFFYLKWVGILPGLGWVAHRALCYSEFLRNLSFTFGDLTDNALPSQQVEAWLEPIKRDSAILYDVRKFLRTINVKDTLSAVEKLKHFNKPVMLIWSTRCRHFPASLATRLQNDLPDVAVRWIDSKGVLLAMEYADVVGQYINEFSNNFITAVDVVLEKEAC